MFYKSIYLGNCPLTISEDCLYLTVTSPLTTSPKTNGYPVIVWIHGGSFVEGTGGSPLYNATYFAKNGILILKMMDY